MIRKKIAIEKISNLTVTALVLEVEFGKWKVDFFRDFKFRAPIQVTFSYFTQNQFVKADLRPKHKV